LRRSFALLIFMVFLLGSCTSAPTTAERPTTSTTSSTSTTAATSTSTSLVVVDGAPQGLVTLIDNFYSYADGRIAGPPPMPPEVLETIVPSPGDDLPTGKAFLGSFKETNIAVVEVGDDLILASEQSDEWRIIGGHWPSLAIPDFYASGPRIVAVVGSDARPGEDVERTRADSIHFVGVNPDGGAAVVGLPRDSYVPIPGIGKRKITGSLALGGPDLMMEAFADLTGLPLEGYLLTGFSGFSDGVDAVLGGIEVTVPFAINDKNAKAALKAGQQLLNGFDALGFARARKTIAGGDLTRSSHQGIILLGAAKGVQMLGPSAIPELMEKAEPYLFTDLSAEQLLTFAVMAINSNLDEVPNVVAQGNVGTAGGASVVFLSDSVGALFADLADGELEN
jgi:polyisoprenyl-teichoic acid--peptidoglycan teichoic acid transferase